MGLRSLTASHNCSFFFFFFFFFFQGDGGPGGGGKGASNPKVSGKAWDIYSLGVLLWWMWHDQTPFSSLDSIFMIADVVR